MPSLLRSIFGFLNKDITGKTWEVRKSHPYFDEMTYFASKEQAKCYWEAQLSVPGQSKKISVTMHGTADSPTEAEEAFCKTALSDLDALFGLCQEAFKPEFQKWAKRPFPGNWRDSFALDGFEVPKEGNEKGEWSVCYFVEPASRYFTAEIKDLRVTNVVIDG